MDVKCVGIAAKFSCQVNMRKKSAGYCFDCFRWTLIVGRYQYHVVITQHTNKPLGDLVQLNFLTGCVNFLWFLTMKSTV